MPDLKNAQRISDAKLPQCPAEHLRGVPLALQRETRPQANACGLVFQMLDGVERAN